MQDGAAFHVPKVPIIFPETPSPSFASSDAHGVGQGRSGRKAGATRGSAGDALYAILTAGSAWIVLLLLGGAAAAMAWGGRLAFQTFGLRFITSSQWDAVNGQFGALVPIFGTLVTSVIAMLIAVPVSLGIAMFVTEIAPRWIRTPIALAIELLAAIPSIIYGMWGLFMFAPFLAAHVEPWLTEHLGTLPFVGVLFNGPPIGIGLLGASIVLGIMIIPFVASVARDVFNAVPPALKEAAVALGATRWEVLKRVTLPYTRSALVGAFFLGLGRALGETMAVTFLIGNSHDLSASLLMPANSIAATIANEFTEADTPLYTSSLIALGFLLFVVTLIVLTLAKLMLRQLDRSSGRTH